MPSAQRAQSEARWAKDAESKGDRSSACLWNLSNHTGLEAITPEGQTGEESKINARHRSSERKFAFIIASSMIAF